jgi:Ca-activated chloride channel homolog
MYFPTRYATKITAASLSLLAAFAVTLSVRSQEQTQDKPTPTSAPTQSPAPATQSPEPTAKQKLGTELDDRSLITNTDLITLTVTVTDTYGRYVSGLSKSAFAVFDNKQQQEITFFSDDDSPVSVGVIFDVSGSMSGDKVKRARDALSKFIQTSHDSDEYFLIAFNSRAQLLLDRTRDGDSILNKLTFVETKSQTALYDACYLGVEKVQRGAHPKSDVTLYAIGILSGSDAGSALGMEGQGVLDELSGVSGGKAFFPRSAAEMDDIFEQIALELRHQYSIGYKPESFVNDGKWHRVKVKVTPPRGLPRLFVRSKEGYYATAGAR